MTFTTVKIRNNYDAQIIISDQKNKFFTIFAATTNLSTIYIGDKNISYKTRTGFPISTLSDTIGLKYWKKIYVTDSNHWFMSGLAGDQLFVLIEDNPFDVWGNLITDLLNQIASRNR